MTDTSTQTAPSQTKTAVSPTPPKRPTKKAQLIKLLSRKSGADAAAISAKFGWQPHTTRAALSGLRKAGFDVTKQSAVAGKPLRYRIVMDTAVVVASADAPNGQ